MTYALFFVMGLSLTGAWVAAAATDEAVKPAADAAAATPASSASDSPGVAGSSGTPGVPNVQRRTTPRVPRGGSPGALEERVRFFTAKLNLDVAQQAKLRRILADQREAVRKIWSNPALSAAERAPATRAANERTGDQIRSILDDEQKKKYNPPAPTSPHPPGDKRTVEDWMNETRPK